MSTQTIPFFDGDEAPYGNDPLYWEYPAWLRVTPSCSGVYVLVQHRSCAYVGKTFNLGKRLLAHHVINFSCVRSIIRGRKSLYIWPCSDPFMSDLEAYLIWCFRPPLNSVQPSTTGISMASLEQCTPVLKELTELIK